ncbi:MAG: transglycosylase SLT domain-containing protein [Maricaulaceae bacterium]|nr:transglycosylase SLT domain-containing protein [Maricaulaceae bacterium]
MITRFAIVLCAFALSAQAHAIPVPRLKPDPANHSRYLDDHDFAVFRRGLAAASDGDWRMVREFRSRLSDRVARDILLWRIATSDPGTSFYELDQAVSDLRGWPLHATIQREAEGKIDSSGMSAAAIADWFSASPPLTGEGRVMLAEAYLQLGRRDEAQTLIRAAWRENNFRAERQREIARRHAALLTQEDHAARVDHLLWTDQRSAARDLMSLLPEGQRRLADARIRLAGRDRGVDTAVNAVPPGLSGDAGLLYERIRWRRRAGQSDENILPLVLELPGEHANTRALSLMWTERRLMILRLIRDGRHAEAYRVASAHGMSSGADFADAEFLAGWLALVHLDRPSDALRHFQTLESGVSFTVSVSRALYWQGRAAEAAGDAEAARRAFTEAAEHATAFYGQMAIAALRGSGADFALPPEPEPDAETRAAFEARPMVRAMRLLAEQDQDYMFRVFIGHYQNVVETPVETSMLAGLARDYLQLRLALRAAKAARQRGEVLPESAYPVIAMPQTPFGVPDPALVHSIIRQETEFDPRSISHAGARGIMQLMPATARETARRMGTPYNADWLLYDPDYNMTLGIAHLDEVVTAFEGSYLLALAAYNAGGSRARQWIRDYGDPRDPDVDPIDWIESIPFSETRNYVMRVLENLQVYRSRLAPEQSSRLQIERDLGRNGEPPPVR